MHVTLACATCFAHHIIQGKFLQLFFFNLIDASDYTLGANIVNHLCFRVLIESLAEPTLVMLFSFYLPNLANEAGLLPFWGSRPPLTPTVLPLRRALFFTLCAHYPGQAQRQEPTSGKLDPTPSA